MGLVAAPFPGRAAPGRYFPLAAAGQEEGGGAEKGGGPAGHPAWSIQRVDTPKIIQAMEDRSLALDAAGRCGTCPFGLPARRLPAAVRRGMMGV